MRSFRRLHARSLLAQLLLLPTLLLSAGACEPGNHLAPTDAAAVIRSAPQFIAPKLIHLPRVLTVRTGGDQPLLPGAAQASEMFGLDQIAAIDAAVAVVKARGEVSIETFVKSIPGPVIYAPPPPVPVQPDSGSQTDSGPPPPPPPAPAPIRGPESWEHTLRITPLAVLSAALAPGEGDDGGDDPAEPPAARVPISRAPGWTLTLGTREFVRVLQVHGPNDHTVKVAAGEALVDFLWRWRPSPGAEPFDASSPEFQSLPPAVQRATAQQRVRIDSSQPLWSRAHLAKTPAGWSVFEVEWRYGEGRDLRQWK
jgi:hypothetical protein